MDNPLASYGLDTARFLADAPPVVITRMTSNMKMPCPEGQFKPLSPEQTAINPVTGAPKIFDYLHYQLIASEKSKAQ